jgi:hypothetical protein
MSKMDRLAVAAQVLLGRGRYLMIKMANRAAWVLLLALKVPRPFTPEVEAVVLLRALAELVEMVVVVQGELQLQQERRVLQIRAVVAVAVARMIRQFRRVVRAVMVALV